MKERGLGPKPGWPGPDHRTNRVSKSFAGVSILRTVVLPPSTAPEHLWYLSRGKAECMHASIACVLLYENYVWVSLASGNAMKAKQSKNDMRSTPCSMWNGAGAGDPSESLCFRPLISPNLLPLYLTALDPPFSQTLPPLARHGIALSLCLIRRPRNRKA